MMQKIMTTFTAVVLCAATGFAQGKSESVDGIFKELANYTSAPAVVAEPPTPAPVAVEVPQPAVAQVEPVVPVQIEQAVLEPVVLTDGTIDTKALMEESREQYAAGEFVKAQQGFEKIVKIAPESWMARMYLRTLMERDQRKMEVEGMKAVSAAWSTDQVVRSYALGSEACEKMGMADTKTAKDVSAIFPQVDFPKGSSAIYQPKMEALFVRNTRENLAVLEAVLGAMNLAKFSTDTDQVEIEAKFIEVSEGTLEELGFEWRSLVGNDIGLGNDVTVPGGQYLFDDALRGGASGPAMPFTQPGSLGYAQTAASGNWSTFRVEDTFSSTPDTLTAKYRGATSLDVVISALDQSSGADVLSAPRIVTKSGEEATIQVGEMHSYPEVFEGNSSQGTMVNVSYQDFSDKLLGVELSVTPEVNGNQITMSLNPRITEIVGWESYLMAPADTIYSYRQAGVGVRFYHDPVVGSLPIFKTRSIETEVTIADGSTIGMGGLISEKVESYEDKVPVLGSLPLVGRFFRNEGERAVKRNLLMFMTARKIDPSGRVNTSRSVE
jgi:type II secretory pathway component GspD/PulD (secretin)